MKQLLVAVTLALTLTGCWWDQPVVQTNIVETPCPKFPIEDFEPAGSYEIKSLKIVEINGVDYVQLPKENFLGLVSEYKKVKKNYNIILVNIKEFQKD